MKKIIHLLVILLFFITTTSCQKTQHSVRITNNSYQGLRVIVGSADFGLVSPEKTTSYQNIPEGTSQISGDVSGVVSVSGKGNVKWTVSISPSGLASIKEDK